MSRSRILRFKHGCNAEKNKILLCAVKVVLSLLACNPVITQLAARFSEGIGKKEEVVKTDYSIIADVAFYCRCPEDVGKPEEVVEIHRSVAVHVGAAFRRVCREIFR